MPARPNRICSKPGCNKLTISRFCETHADHAKLVKRESERWRGTAQQRGYTYQWSKARTAYLKLYPLCRRCLAVARHQQADVVDHIQPHKGDQGLFWDRENWQPLCKRCHDIKTTKEDGGFGHSISKNK